MNKYLIKVFWVIKSIILKIIIYFQKLLYRVSNKNPERFDREAAENDIEISKETVNQYLSRIKLHCLYPFIQEVKDFSMLHEDVLYLLRFLGIASRGIVVEIGAFIGGSTVALASGRKMYHMEPIITVEAGGKRQHPDLPSDDIFKDLTDNINRYNLNEYVDLKNGFSNQDDVYEFIKDRAKGKGIGLLFIDADGNIERDINIYSDLLNDQCVFIFDDYHSDYAPEKTHLIKDWVEKAEAEGRVKSFGVYGWGTWIGLYNK